MIRTHPLPRGFSEGHAGSLKCPHRDLSCCPACAGQYPGRIVDVRGAHYWMCTDAEREELLAIMREP